jgi:hypothetical protein
MSGVWTCGGADDSVAVLVGCPDAMGDIHRRASKPTARNKLGWIRKIEIMFVFTELDSLGGFKRES